MSENQQPAGPTGRPQPGDVGRRIVQRREALGLSRDDVAARTGMAAEYVRYVEEHPAQPEPDALTRLAGVLQTTVEQLRGGEVDLPPGRGVPSANPVFEPLTPEECRARLSSCGVGRVAFGTDLGIEVLPVNYSVIDGSIVYRTGGGAAPAAAIRQQVAFEVDRVDDVLSQGWSVLANGPAERITDPEEIDRLAGDAPLPWTGGPADLWIRITPDRLTGRIIRTV
ncbi:helix-turn-helix domain-containing protein [Peterkaempfera sp. SMS 1(5)a]|uniref:helix-turn-helix domain-containing protein n=1 Tax=Peterkaempfera podocarpi TaxID=3232308 RepID=UPI00366DBBB9